MTNPITFLFNKGKCKPGKHKFVLFYVPLYKEKTLANKNESHFGQWYYYVCKRKHCRLLTEVKQGKKANP